VNGGPICTIPESLVISYHHIPGGAACEAPDQTIVTPLNYITSLNAWWSGCLNLVLAGFCTVGTILSCPPYARLRFSCSAIFNDPADVSVVGFANLTNCQNITSASTCHSFNVDASSTCTPLLLSFGSGRAIITPP
jgi:hypothetical protein